MVMRQIFILVLFGINAFMAGTGHANWMTYLALILTFVVCCANIVSGSPD